MVIPVVVGALGTVSKGVEKKLGELKIRGRIKTVQTTALLKSVEYLEESWRSEETCSHSDQWKPPIRAKGKNS